MAKKVSRKRYNLVLPEELFDAVQQMADEKDTTVVELIRKFLRLGLVIADAEKDDLATLYIREGDQEKQIHLFM
jgi:hypothetical protein